MESISDPTDLPPEIFRQFLSPLSRQQVAHASSTSKNWKECVEGDRFLFTEVNAIRFPGQEKVSNQEMSEKVVDHLKRFSHLSRWNLQKARLDLGLLANGEKMIAKTWDWTTLPGVALQTLTLSRKSLKVLSFDLARLSIEDEEVLPTVADQVIAMIRFTETDFKNCKDLTIRASTYLTLVSKSDSKTLSVIHSQKDDDEEEEEEPLIAEERDAELFPNDFQMIYEMGEFTGGKIVKVIGEKVRTYNQRSLQMLTKSLDSLSEIRVDAESIIHLEGWLEWFTFSTPNLERLQIRDSMTEDETFFIQVLESSNVDDPSDIVVSNLKELNLLCHKVGSIRWDDLFTKWIGNQLETLDIGWRSGLEEEVPVNLTSFVDFLKNNASTLWHIRIEGIALASLPEGLDLEGLTLPKLTSLKLDTNPETVEFFTKVKMPILSRLNLAVSDKAEKKELPHDDVMKLLKASSQTLTALHLGENLSDPEEGSEISRMKFQPSPNPLGSNSSSFIKLQSLNLTLNAPNVSAYCSLDYPSLQVGSVRTQSAKLNF